MPPLFLSCFLASWLLLSLSLSYTHSHPAPPQQYPFLYLQPPTNIVWLLTGLAYGPYFLWWLQLLQLYYSKRSLTSSSWINLQWGFTQPQAQWHPGIRRQCQSKPAIGRVSHANGERERCGYHFLDAFDSQFTWQRCPFNIRLTGKPVTWV